MDLENKVILITGAASGIGAGVATYLATLGGKVSLVDLDSNGLDVTLQKIEESGSPEPFKVVANITKDGTRIIDETVKHFGRLDVLVNCAGILKWDNIIDLNIDDFDHVLDVNLKGAVILTNLAVPHLTKTKGSIVNVASVSALKAYPNKISYCVSKAALVQFTKCCALDLASIGIRVNAVNPAAIKTPIFEKLGIPKSEVHEMVDNFVKKDYPMGRCGDVKDIAAAIAYLIGDNGSFITGTSLNVDGGCLAAN